MLLLELVFDVSDFPLQVRAFISQLEKSNLTRLVQSVARVSTETIELRIHIRSKTHLFEARALMLQICILLREAFNLVVSLHDRLLAGRQFRRQVGNLVLECRCRRRSVFLWLVF